MIEFVNWIKANDFRFAYILIAGSVNFIHNKKAGRQFSEFSDEFITCLAAAWAVEKIMFVATGLPPGTEILACVLIGYKCRLMMEKFGLKKAD